MELSLKMCSAEEQLGKEFAVVISFLLGIPQPVAVSWGAPNVWLVA